MLTLKKIFLVLTLALGVVSLPAAAVECHEQPNGEMLCDGKVFVQPAEEPASSAAPAALEALPTEVAPPASAAEAPVAESPASVKTAASSATKTSAPAAKPTRTTTPEVEDDTNFAQGARYAVIILLVLGLICFVLAISSQNIAAAALGVIFISIGIAIDVSLT